MMGSSKAGWPWWVMWFLAWVNLWAVVTPTPDGPPTWFSAAALAACLIYVGVTRP